MKYKFVLLIFHIIFLHYLLATNEISAGAEDNLEVFCKNDNCDMYLNFHMNISSCNDCEQQIRKECSKTNWPSLCKKYQGLIGSGPFVEELSLFRDVPQPAPFILTCALSMGATNWRNSLFNLDSDFPHNYCTELFVFYNYTALSIRHFLTGQIWNGLEQQEFSHYFMRINELKKANKELKTIFSIGESANVYRDDALTELIAADWDDALLNSTTAIHFFRRLFKFAKHFDFDYVDVAWFYTTRLRQIIEVEKTIPIAVGIARIDHSLPIFATFYHNRGGSHPVTEMYFNVTFERFYVIGFDITPYFPEMFKKTHIAIDVWATSLMSAYENATFDGYPLGLVSWADGEPITNATGRAAYYEICRHKLFNTRKYTKTMSRSAYMSGNYKIYNFHDEETLKFIIDKNMRLYKVGGAVFNYLDWDDFRGVCGKKYPILSSLNNLQWEWASALMEPFISLNKTEVTILVSTLLIAVVLAIGCYIVYRRLSMPKYTALSSTEEPPEIIALQGKLSQFWIEIVDKNPKTGFEGEVREAEYRPHENGELMHVAVKKSRSKLFTDADIWREIRLLAECKHENIVTFIGYYLNGQKEIHIVTEFLKGGSLLDFLRRSETNICPNSALNYMFQICNGMNYLAEKDIVHRDLSARNCVLDQSHTLLKIIDFGLCRETDDSNHYYRSSAAGKLHLPWRWMPLEVLQGSAKFSQKTDIWSFGVVTWEIFEKGNQPYDKIVRTSKELCAFLREDKRLGVENIPKQISERIILPCWNKNSRQRPTFKEILLEIEQQLNGSAAEQLKLKRKILDEPKMINNDDEHDQMKENMSSESNTVDFDDKHSHEESAYSDNQEMSDF